GYGGQGYQQPGYEQPTSPYNQPTGYGQDMWAQQQPPPKKRGSGLLITLVVVLAVLVCGGGAAGAYVAFKPKGNAKGTATATSTGKAATQPTGAATTAAPTPTDTGGEPADDAATAQVGDCLANQGTNDKPALKKVACKAGVFEVLKRFDGTADVKKCTGVAGYTHNYYFKTDSEASNFVLCMKQRT